MSELGKYVVSEGKVFEPLDDNKYQVEIYKAESEMGLKFQTAIPEAQLKITFVVLDEDKTVAEEGVQVPVRGRRLWTQTTTVFSPVGSKKPTKLTQLTTAVFGHELEKAEVETFDENDLTGKQLCVMVGPKVRADGSKGNKILSYSKAVKQLPKYDDSEWAERNKPDVVKKSEAVDTSGFEADMDKLAEENAKKAKK